MNRISGWSRNLKYIRIRNRSKFRSISSYKYTHEVKNEILDILATLTLQEKLKTIRERKLFSIIADEVTDVSNKKQLSICLRIADKDLNSAEDFIGF